MSIKITGNRGTATVSGVGGGGGRGTVNGMSSTTIVGGDNVTVTTDNAKKEIKISAAVSSSSGGNDDTILPVSKGSTGAATADAARKSLGVIGKSLAGQTVSPAYGESVTAGVGAEIFNDYRERTYNRENDVNYGNIASGDYSTATGQATTASGVVSTAMGKNTKAEYYAETAIGRYNATRGTTDVSNTIGDFFVVGKGSSEEARANAFRVSNSGVYGTSAFNASGADYAELFEWADGNPDGQDRVGRFVTLDGEKIRIADANDDYILGVISGSPSVVGDVHDDQWQGMFLYDEFGRPIWEDVEVPGETMEEPDPEDPDKTITRVIVPAHTEHRQKVNPDYDHTQKYVPRTERPEWDAVGMVGKLLVRDDGSCKVNNYCKVGSNGIATASDKFISDRSWRVIGRIDKNIIKVIVK